MKNSKIEWCSSTANGWHGCSRVHEGCDNCYAATLAKRYGNDIWGNDKPRKEIKSFFPDLGKYQKTAKEAGEIHRIFVGSMMDIFEKPMPVIDHNGELKSYTTDKIRQEFFAEINDNAYPNLMFLFLTKRPSNINKYIPEGWKTNPPSNVMYGTSPVNQATADRLIPQLLRVNGRRFLSVEPQLDGINIQEILFKGGIHWLISGGESGPHKRPFNADWARQMRDDCIAAGVPFFMKQIDKIQPIPEDLMIREFPKMQTENAADNVNG